MRIICLLIIFLSHQCWSFNLMPNEWNSIFKIAEKHQFYKSNEVIDRPEGTWQHLFSVAYSNQDLSLIKDCIFYFVPEKTGGILKIKTTLIDDSCEKYLFEQGDIEIKDLRSIQYEIDKGFEILFTTKDFTSFKWKGKNHYPNKKSDLKVLMSSAQYQTGSHMFLSSKLIQSKKTTTNPKVCHDVGEDCKIKSTSNCELCPEGWYEVPNGCPQSPKFCGMQLCGLKNRPACNRGKTYRDGKKIKIGDCRTDPFFVYCSKGLSIYCEGNLAYCR